MRKSSVLLVMISVACAFSAVWSWWRLRLERAHVAQLEQQLASALAPVNAARTTDNTSASQPGTTVTPAPSPTASASAAATAATSQPPPQSKEVVDHVRAWQQREREMLRDPAYRKSQVDAWRRRMAQTRADAIRVAGMTPEQADRVVELWAERNLRFIELGATTGEPPSEAVRAELKRTGEAEQAEVRELLGMEIYEKWQRYLASGSERGEVGQFRLQLSTTSEPLRDSQADALVEAIYSERQRRTNEYEDYVQAMGITDRNMVSAQDRQRWLDLEKEANQRIHDTMAGTLSRAQLTSLDEMLGARLVPIETALRMQLEGKVAKSN